ncbi:MAG: class I SAM-dependent methyltransferase [Rickettsiales bacterium]
MHEGITPVTQEMVEQYLEADPLSQLIDTCSQLDDEQLTCQRWLRDTPPKRAIFQELYGDLLEPGGKTLIDVGGGLTALTRYLSRKNELTLIDPLAHDTKEQAAAFLTTTPDMQLIQEDWYNFHPQQTYDVVIANDLFPNADQRLRLFLERFLPHTREIRLLLTYYNTPRFYVTRRVDAEEILTLLAWDGEQLAHILRKFVSESEHESLQALEKTLPSLYPNGRQVCMVTIKGQAN